MANIHGLNRSNDGGDDDDDENSLYVGGAGRNGGSGQAVLGGPGAATNSGIREDIMGQIISQAQRYCALPRWHFTPPPPPPLPPCPRMSFHPLRLRAARLLLNADVASSRSGAFAGNSTGGPQRTVTVWKNGFKVDDGQCGGRFRAPPHGKPAITSTAPAASPRH